MLDAKQIIEQISANATYLDINYKLFDIYNRNLTPYIEARLENDFKSDNAKKELKTRLSPVNIFPAVIDKLSQVYRTRVYRTTVFGIDQQQLDTIYDEWKIQQTLSLANRYLNISRCVAIEPVFAEKRLRVLPAHKFLVIGDGTIDQKIVAFVKILGTQVIDNKQKNVYEIITPESYTQIDDEGNVLSTVENPMKEIPIIYATRDIVTLMPPPDLDTFNMITLLPILLSDGNFALKYQCFSIIYTMNLDAKNMTLSPNAVWHLSSNGADGDKTEIGMLRPSVAVQDILEYIKAQYSLWLESRKLKMSALSKIDFSASSGIAKAIDQADITADLNYQREIFVNIEQDLIALIGRFFNSEWKISVYFEPEAIMPETNIEKLNAIITKLQNKLISWEYAVELANEHMLKSQIDALKQQILKENSDGQIRSGNNIGSQAQ